MIIQTLEKNTNVRLYYKSNNTVTGLDVVFNLWDFDSNPILTNAPATGEIGTKGLYYINFTTPNTDTYLVGTAEVVDGKLSEKKPIVLKVGVPDQNLFYVDAEYTTGRTVPYQIYSVAGDLKDSGSLSELTGGFYYADVSALSEDLTYLFEANNNLAESFTLEEILTYYYEGTGGFVFAGNSDTSFYSYPIFEYEGTGGVVLGGAADTSLLLLFEYEGTGGVVLGGAADTSSGSYQLFEYEGTGGFVLGGAADTSFYNLPNFQYEGTGGFVLGGAADTSFGSYQLFEYEGTGGVVLGGAADTSSGSFQGFAYEASGGFVLGGAADTKFIFGYEASGGFRLTGSAQSSVHNCYVLPYEWTSDASSPLIQRIERAISRLEKLYSISPTTGEQGEYLDTISTEEKPYDLERISSRLKRLQKLVAPPKVGGYYLQKPQQIVPNTQGLYGKAIEKLNRLKGISTSTGASGNYSIQETQTVNRGPLLEKTAKRLTILRNQAIAPTPSPSQFEKTESSNVSDLSVVRREALERLLKLEQIATNQGTGGHAAETTTIVPTDMAANLAEAINRIDRLNSIEKQGSCI